MDLPIKKEAIKTVIITSNTEFKAKAVALLNNVAFIAEKFTQTEFDPVRSSLISDPKMRNVVVDCTCPEGKDFITNPDLAAIIAKSGAFILAYFETNADPILSLESVRLIPNFNSQKMPQLKEHYINIFHARKPIPPGGQVKKVAPVVAEAAKPGAVFIEATLHVKASFDALTACLKDRKNLTALEAVGQRFNGVFGTYSFFGEREGFKELSQLSTVIDDICRTYVTGKFPEITESHAQLLLDAARCSFLMLKELRESLPLPAVQKAELNRITSLYGKDDTIGKRASQKQEDIDSMIDDLMNKAS